MPMQCEADAAVLEFLEFDRKVHSRSLQGRRDALGFARQKTVQPTTNDVAAPLGAMFGRTL
jgi:hypothetical protein